LEWLVHQYEEHMRFHELKFKRGVLEIVVTIAAEIAEDWVKISLVLHSRIEPEETASRQATRSSYGASNLARNPILKPF